ARTLDTRRVRQLRNELLEETRGGFVFGELRLGQTEAERQGAPWIHPDIDFLQEHEAAHRQARADEEHESEGDLGDDERIAHPPALRPARAGTAAFLESVDEARIRGLESRQ